MIRLSMAAIALLSLLAIGASADSTTQPAKPTTSPSGAAMKPAGAQLAGGRVQAKSPAADAAKPDGKLPTPDELIARMNAKDNQKAKLPKVAYFDLTNPISEKPADFSWMGGDPGQGLTLRVLLDRLDHARQDNDVRGVLITLGDSGLNLSQAIELRDALNALRRDGKRTFVYADAYDTDTYVAACGATDVCMMEGGEIEIPGVGFELTFLKGLMDKVGVKADYVQIGEYKGASEEYTRLNASDEFKGELNKLADSLYDQIVDTISISRNLSRQDVKEIIDDSLITGTIAKKRGLVDHLVDEDGLRGLMADELGQKVDLVADYGQAAHEQVDLSSPFALFSLLSRKPAASTRAGVAVIYADGVIVDGSGGGGLLSTSENIGSDTMRQALRTAERDNKIEAVIIRIDSPGGSALASEVMWQASRRVAKSKPVIISIGSEAASGGYYLASSGDYIFADPTAIVGSIGVVGGKIVTKDLYTMLGLNAEEFLRGRNADLFSSNAEWTDRQRRQVTNWMHDTYDQFTQRVMTTRQGKIKDIDAVARGRIFSAKQARDLGMVDQIGGIQDAIAYAAKQADLQPGEYDVRVLPAPKTFADIFAAASGDDSSSRSPIVPHLSIGVESAWRALPPAMRQSIGRQIQVMLLLQQKPFVLAAPFDIIVK